MTEEIYGNQKGGTEKDPEAVTANAAFPPLTNEVKRTNSDSFTPTIGRIKPPPVCVAHSLRVSSAGMTELSAKCFTPTEARAFAKRTSNSEIFAGPAPPTEAALPSSCSTVVSSTSSTASNASTGSQYDDMQNPALPTPENRGALQPQTSRTGRLNQRWHTDPQNNHVYRLTTGTVPIMNDGSILFVSSRAKPQWILPKGGWESDESMEQSARRETFEEAGVLGEVGPLLSEVEYEAGKAKQRRLDKEALEHKKKLNTKGSNLSSSSATEHNPQKEGGKPETNAKADSSNILQSKDTLPSDIEVTSSVVPVDDSTSIGSIVSDSSAPCYTHVRMSLFPLYVHEVHEKWPESGRARRLFDIDSAIRMLEHRPEFRSVLEEVKQKGLHLLNTDR